MVPDLQSILLRYPKDNTDLATEQRILQKFWIQTYPNDPIKPGHDLDYRMLRYPKRQY